MVSVEFLNHLSNQKSHIYTTRFKTQRKPNEQTKTKNEVPESQDIFKCKPDYC